MEKIVSFGERSPGSLGHKRCREYIIKVLKEKGFLVKVQKFEEGGLSFYNIIGDYGKGKKVLIGTHYDTYPGIIGANDGGSGVALLLSILDSLKKFNFGIEVVFFDGEDYGNAPLYGSKYFSKNIKQEDYHFGIIVDMIGDKELQIYKEINSLNFSPFLTDKFFEIAYKNNLKSFVPFPKYSIIDDHIPLNEKGVKCLLLIDFDYPYWHTIYDDIFKCSENSLEEVGKAIILFLKYFENER